MLWVPFARVITWAVGVLAIVGEFAVFSFGIFVKVNTLELSLPKA